MFIVLVVSNLYAQRLDTRTNVTHFFNLSQNDFEIDSKSKVVDEQKSYASLKEADIDGGAPDGKITYSEYLTYLGKTSPQAVTDFDFALLKILPFLKNIQFPERDYSIQGVFSQPVVVGKDVTLPAGAKISIFQWDGAIKVNIPADVSLRGFSVRGGGDVPLHLGYHNAANGFSPTSFQLTKDTIINQVPCKAVSVPSWMDNIQLYPDGSVMRTALSAEYVNNGIAFFPGEVIALSNSGALDSAVILQSRVDQDRKLIANIKGDYTVGPRAVQPNIYFENGKIKWAYEQNKSIGQTVIAGIHAYQYAADGTTVTAIQLQSPYFLGFPVALPKPRQWWDLSQPVPNVTLTDGQATFTTDVGIQLESGSKKVVLPAGSMATIEMATGACLSVKLATGAMLSYTVEDKMRPLQVSVEQQNAQMLRWAEQWLTAHPEAKDGINKDVRQSYFQLRDQLVALEKKAAQDALSSKCINVVLLFKDKSKGLIPGNIAFDFNGDGKIQETELVPATLLEPDSTVFSVEKLFGYLVENAERLPKNSLSALSKIMTALPIAAATDNFGVFDKLGSILSKVGIHPFADKKIYFFPNGSGDNVVIQEITFYPSGSPKKIVPVIPDVVGAENDHMSMTLPGSESRVVLDFWTKDRLATTKGLLPAAIEFHPNGDIKAVGGRYIHNMPMPSALITCDKPFVGCQFAEYTDKGYFLHLVPYEKALFTLPGDIVAESPRDMYWRADPKTGKQYFMTVYLTAPVSVLFKKGQTVSVSRLVNGAVALFPETFKEDTKMSVTGGLQFDPAGNIIKYWQ